MGRVNTPELTPEERSALQEKFKSDTRHCVRMRCHSILLKADGLDSIQVGRIVGLSDVSVNSWVKRYKAEGIDGLDTGKGRGRKALINKAQDEKTIALAVQANRQRIELARAEWEEKTGKSASNPTFRRFLKSLVQDSSA